MGKRRGRPRGRGVADREAPAAGNLRVTRQTSKMMQCGSSTVAKEMVLLGTDNVPLTLLDPSTVPPQSESPLVTPLRCSNHDAERERSSEFTSQNENHNIHHVIPQIAHQPHLSADKSPEFHSQNENHNIHPVIPQIAHLSADNFLEDEVESSTVEGYEVRPEHAHMLRLIFAKYGNIAKNSDLRSPESLSHFLEMVCSIILKLQESNFRGVTSFQLDRMLGKIQDLEKEKFNVGWLRTKVEDIKEKKMLDNKYSELQEDKAKIERQKKLLESCEADLAALQAEVFLFQRRSKK